MTTVQFRENPVKVGALKALLIGENDQPSILAEAIIAVQNERPSPKVPEHSPEIVSVRRLDNISGFDESLELLLSCAEPLPPPVVEERATFNVDPEKFKQLYPDK
jgi:hypothetical protein